MVSGINDSNDDMTQISFASRVWRARLKTRTPQICEKESSDALVESILAEVVSTHNFHRT